MNIIFDLPTRVIFGSGSINELLNENLPYKKALIVTQKGILQELGYIKKVSDILNKKNVEVVVFDDVQENPTVENVANGTKAFLDNNCDVVVAIGGGSPIDVAKCIAIMATNEGDLWDYASGSTGKEKEIKETPMPIIAIPTTAGTGSEADPWAVITKKETREKTGVGNHGIFPTLSIVDPDFTMTIPPYFTALQGMDAFFHAAEGYIACTANDMSQIFSLKAVEYLAKYLPVAVANGADKTAREKVCFASMLGGFVQSTTHCTSLHSYGQSFAAYKDNIPHGASLILICIEYFKLYLGVVDERYVALAKAMGKDDAKTPDDFFVALEKMLKDCKVDDIKMSDYGILYDELNLYVENTNENGGCPGDPAAISDEAALTMYQKSYR